MRKNLLFALVMLITTINIFALKGCFSTGNTTVALASFSISTPESASSPTLIPRNASLTISSPAFRNGQMIPKTYTCDGQSINPSLLFSNIPQGTASLALIVDDPDAPAGTWVHWVVFNISPTTKTIAQNSVPVGSALGTTSFGRPGYGGPCPPSGTHRYFFKLYALDTTLKADTKTTKATLEKEMQGHILEKAQIIGLYRRA